MFESRIQELHALHKLAREIRSFFRLLHFFIIGCCIFSVSMKMGLADAVIFLQNNIMIDNALFLEAGLS
jgi:hypothetical protein